ncbi:MAG: hypothetical protein KGH75_06845 [Rhodospirillales bacterium]|nr:hypothetical protein [Rhodospirillales bacterium]
MKKILCWLCLWPLMALGQIDYSTIILSGSGEFWLNGTYSLQSGIPLTTNAVYTNNLGYGIAWGISGSTYYWFNGSGDYISTNFPYQWIPYTMGTPGPGATGVYGGWLTKTNWVTTTSNYWGAPADIVYFRGAGWNMSSGANSNRLSLTLDGHALFTGPFTSGAGMGWQLSGQVVWDGTNFLSTGRFDSGDTNQPFGADSELITNAIAGTNQWAWVVSGDTNGLTFDAAQIAASRAPIGDVPVHSLQLFGVTTNYTVPGGATLYITNGSVGAVH